MSHAATGRPNRARHAIAAAVAGLIGFTLIAVLVARLTAADETDASPLHAVESRSLVFEDMPDGSVLVLEAVNGRQVDLLEPGSGGFVRGVLRSLDRNRKLRGIPAGQAYELVRWDDGRLSLLDSSGDARIDLEAFGPTNIQSFARLLRPASPGSSGSNQVSLRQQ